MKETTKISLRNHAMSDQTKQDNTVSKSRSNGVLSCVWINVKQRLPEPGQIVLWWNDDIRMIEFGSSGSFNGENVTYWMPLPEPPPAR